MSSGSDRPEPQQVDSLLQIGSRRIYDSTHDAYRESVRNFYQDQCVPFHEEWENKGEVPRELWQEAGANGMLSVTVPEEYGGMGLDILFSSINWQEQSYAGTTGPGWALHSEIVAPYLVHYGTEEQKQEWLPKMVTGDAITAIAMTEPGAGSDLQGMRTNAVKVKLFFFLSQRRNVDFFLLNFLTFFLFVFLLFLLLSPFSFHPLSTPCHRMVMITLLMVARHSLQTDG